MTRGSAPPSAAASSTTAHCSGLSFDAAWAMVMVHLRVYPLGALALGLVTSGAGDA